MQSTILRTTLVALGLAASIGFAPAAFAEVQIYTADLKGSSEVPPITDSKGYGMVEATYDTATKKFAYNVSYANLTGPAMGAHFHGPATVKENAGVMVPVKDPGSPSPIHGETTIDGQQATDLQAGKWYFNVHTAAHKEGEIRGQLVRKK
jgi:hypothetical protein